jgi:hypothetical protein
MPFLEQASNKPRTVLASAFYSWWKQRQLVILDNHFSQVTRRASPSSQSTRTPDDGNQTRDHSDLLSECPSPAAVMLFYDQLMASRRIPAAISCLTNRRTQATALLRRCHSLSQEDPTRVYRSDQTQRSLRRSHPALLLARSDSAPYR